MKTYSNQIGKYRKWNKRSKQRLYAILRKDKETREIKALALSHSDGRCMWNDVLCYLMNHFTAKGTLDWEIKWKQKKYDYFMVRIMSKKSPIIVDMEYNPDGEMLASYGNRTFLLKPTNDE
jgi:hypothetical protein